MNYVCHYASVLGDVLIASDGAALTGLWFQGQTHFPDGLNSQPQPALPVFYQTRRWLDIYFSGEIPDFMPPIAFSGTAFQKEVWSILLEIPYGHTATYGEIAGELARRKGKSSISAQAVGQAVGRNPISIIVPCHRILGKNGSLTGYAGGLERKTHLLVLEGVLSKDCTLL